MIKRDFLNIWEKLQIWEALKAENLNAYFLIGKALFLTPPYRNRKPFFNIISGLSHRPDQINHKNLTINHKNKPWKFTLGGP